MRYSLLVPQALRIARIATLIFLFAATASAGEIYGSLFYQGRPVPQGTKVGLTCGGKNYEVATDARGVYRVFANETGTCDLAVQFDNRTWRGSVYSYADSARFDFSLENSGGEATLRRK